MFQDQFYKILECPVRKKDLTLPIYDIFLQIESNGLRIAKIFHRLGNTDPCLLANLEKMIDRRTAREYYRTMVEYFDPLSAEFL